MGLVLVWMNEEQTASLWNDDTLVRLKINSSTMDVNGKTVELDAAPAIINDRTYMPVRAILEAFGAQVHWKTLTLVFNIPPMHGMLNF